MLILQGRQQIKRKIYISAWGFMSSSTLPYTPIPHIPTVIHHLSRAPALRNPRQQRSDSMRSRTPTLSRNTSLISFAIRQSPSPTQLVEARPFREEDSFTTRIATTESDSRLHSSPGLTRDISISAFCPSNQAGDDREEFSPELPPMTSTVRYGDSYQCHHQIQSTTQLPKALPTAHSSAIRLAETYLQIRGTQKVLKPFPTTRSTLDNTSTPRNSSYRSSPSHSPTRADDAFVTLRSGDALRETNGTTSQQVFEAKELDDAALAMIELLQCSFNADDDEMHYSPDSVLELKRHLLLLCQSLLAMEQEPPVLHLTSPLMVCGDLHGSYADLDYFLQQHTPFGSAKFLSTPILFLGDYVDRGPQSIEVVALVFAWKVLNPTSVLLLRGNHEDPLINGDIDHYGTGSFLHKCIEVFGSGADEGVDMWALINRVFERLPIAAIIDNNIFACHGGIPRLRYPQGYSGFEGGPCGHTHPATSAEISHYESPSHPDAIPSYLFDQLINNTYTMPMFKTVMPDEDDSAEMATHRRLQREILWNDPVGAEFSEAQGEGFRPNSGRGDQQGIILEFDQRAITQFLSYYGWSLILRAHQHKTGGMQLTNSARIVTVFTSANYAGEPDSAGACLVVNKLLRLVSWNRAATLAVAGQRSETCAIAENVNQSGVIQAAESTREPSPWHDGRLPEYYTSDDHYHYQDSSYAYDPLTYSTRATIEARLSATYGDSPQMHGSISGHRYYSGHNATVSPDSSISRDGSIRMVALMDTAWGGKKGLRDRFPMPPVGTVDDEEKNLPIPSSALVRKMISPKLTNNEFNYDTDAMLVG